MNKFLCLFFFIWAQIVSSEEKPFVIVTYAHNNKAWYQKNLNSVLSQKYSNYRIIYLADGSTDGSTEEAEKYVAAHCAEDKVTVRRHDKPYGRQACITGAAFSCTPEEIVIELDGSDWLAHAGVLSYLNTVYSNPEVWMTYGQFVYYPHAREGFAAQIPEEIIIRNEVRYLGGHVTHLRSFYAGLFHEINKDDLILSGYFYPRAGDLAYMIPMLEMAGFHSRFIPNILYVLNYTGSIQEEATPNRIEKDIDRFIRRQAKYKPLNKLVLNPAQKILDSYVFYQQLTDLNHPTHDDYQFLQQYLSHCKRENLDRLGTMESGIRNVKLIGNSEWEKPIFGSIAVNCQDDDRQNCILLYSTFNKNYPNALERLLNHLIASDFKGHVLYRIGGWPNAEAGSLVLSHVPYGFKVAFFKEAEQLGYKRILWLDTAVLPVVSMNQIFDQIQSQGYFVMGNSHDVGPYMTSQTATYFGLTLEQTYYIPSCSAGLFGIDLSKPVGKRVLNEWHRAAFDKDAFFSSRSDQNALSIILYQNHLTDFADIRKMPHAENNDPIQEDSLFYLDRLYAQQPEFEPPHLLTKTKKKKVYISPGYWGELFSISNPVFNRDGCLEVLYQLRAKAREEGFELFQADDLNHLEDFEYLIVFEVIPEQLPMLKKYPKEKLILFLWEPPSVIPENYKTENHELFSKVYTWNDTLIDGQKYFKLYYPVMKPMLKNPIPFNEKKLCTLIACNKHSDYPGELYSERRNLVDFFENANTNDFTLFGRGWPDYKNYAGAITTKADVLPRFRFCFAYENIRDIPGYITEKIFDCFHASVVPVYWGASNIRDLVPDNCYIDRTQFVDNASLYAFLKQIDEQTHNQYLENIKTFLNSEAVKAYSREQFIESFISLIKE